MSSNSSYDRRAVLAWALYDFGNSAYSAVVLTFLFSTYFSDAVAPDNISGTSLWAWGLTVSGLTVAFLSPFMGALADAGGFRKRFLFGFTLLAVLATASLYTVLPGQVTKALILFVTSSIAMEMGMVFYNAFLPDIAPADKIGRISGYGWGLGYAGGLIAMGLCLVGFVYPEQPWFGVSKENFQHIRATNLLVAVWFACFAIPIFVWVKEPEATGAPALRSFVGATYRQLRTTFQEIRRYRQIVRLLVARIFYNDGVVTLYSFGGIYAKGTMGFSFTEIMIFGIVLNVTAGVGALALGFLDDLIGGKKTIQFTNGAFIVATLLAIFAPNKTVFWIAGIIVGFFLGPNQAASRSLMGRFVPPDKESEFFGFFAFSGKATAFMGPFLLGYLNRLFGSQKVGVAIVIVFFAIGMLILTRVDEQEGRRLSGRTGKALQN